jgi:hypothetical protein
MLLCRQFVMLSQVVEDGGFCMYSQIYSAQPRSMGDLARD